MKRFREMLGINQEALAYDLGAYIGNAKPTFNINLIEKLKKLHEEKIALYERMLREKDEMMLRLEQLINKK